jgi:hypothetical protein
MTTSAKLCCPSSAKPQFWIQTTMPALLVLLAWLFLVLAWRVSVVISPYEGWLYLAVQGCQIGGGGTFK